MLLEAESSIILSPRTFERGSNHNPGVFGSVLYPTQELGEPAVAACAWLLILVRADSHCFGLAVVPAVKVLLPMKEI